MKRLVLIPASVGLTVIVGVNFFVGWWLDSGARVVFTVLTLFFAMFAVVLLSGSTWRAAVAMWAGVLVTMGGILATHTDNMWPIVMFIGGVLAGGAILLGTAAAVALEKYGSLK